MTVKDKLIIVASMLLVTGLVIIGQAHARSPDYPGKYISNDLTLDEMIDTSAMDKRDLEERQAAQDRLILQMLKSQKGNK